MGSASGATMVDAFVDVAIDDEGEDVANKRLVCCAGDGKRSCSSVTRASRARAHKWHPYDDGGVWRCGPCASRFEQARWGGAVDGSGPARSKARLLRWQFHRYVEERPMRRPWSANDLAKLLGNDEVRLLHWHSFYTPSEWVDDLLRRRVARVVARDGRGALVFAEMAGVPEVIGQYWSDTADAVLAAAQAGAPVPNPLGIVPRVYAGHLTDASD